MPPRWNDPDFAAGTMVRAALWLLDEIGEGNSFTKEQVREAFPGVSQADRRIRDLRNYGWVIHTSSDDAGLNLEEQRLVSAGVPVWDPQARREVQAKNISAKERQATLAHDAFQCVMCGIAGGEAYPDAPSDTAVLGISRRVVQLSDGSTDQQLITECKRCRAGADISPTDVGRLLSDIRDLDAAERDRLIRWMGRGRRGPTPLDRVWNAYRRLPGESRNEIAKQLHM
jgi:hypothetical protein